MKLIYIIAIAFVAVGCNKERLERASESGRHTASWYAFGKAYKTTDREVTGGPSLAATKSVSIDGPILTLTARIKGNSTNVIYIRVVNYQGPGVYLLNSDKNFGRLELESRFYDNLSTRKGYLEVTKEETGVLAGKFEFLCGIAGGELPVTQGRFDVEDWKP